MILKSPREDKTDKTVVLHGRLLDLEASLIRFQENFGVLLMGAKSGEVPSSKLIVFRFDTKCELQDGEEGQLAIPSVISWDSSHQH